ncbi:D-lactate dehydrogenase KNAG_0C03700 [Huiozyma naganishii CBS 8797]|uniref:D-lactate dehydrogenase (cytochrome) n=1 Tax=Huiozyma naganishii (strain ATCC MYA-139 / BCRC 22969 / CBS 8797 / KCTC 17520 / NBRC 10181 / NCYC 3082 / Yp74L-3) TaxID=1071383 RepID=J7S4V3_HUIN7|nr:hypothetical protein KNAG_0C03700 [Kazachstania naganishii CBS 8797]CCK69474.1 hypothetical protein KNAG_0C03700 [Kazachstania naganishii CBS 8797]
MTLGIALRTPLRRPWSRSSLQVLRVRLPSGSRGYVTGGQSPPSRSWGKAVVVAGAAGCLGYLLSQSKEFKRWEKYVVAHESAEVKELIGHKHQIINDQSVTKLEELEPLRYNTDQKEIAELVRKLKAVLENNEDNFTHSPGELEQHSDSDFNTHHPTPQQRPLIVLFPHTTDQVSQIVALCHEYNVPIVPFSGGTSLEGHYLPTRNPTISIDISKYMNNIIKFDKTDLDVTVQGGLPWEDLQDFLNDQGLLFGCDPGPGAQIAGCVANSCSGTKAYRYGTMKENVLNLTVVLPDGSIVRTKRRPKKSSAGYNLNGLFTGSEGTLGIVTEVTLKTHVKPRFETVVVVSFPSIADAAACSSSITQAGINVNAMELLDDNMMHLINVNDATPRNDWLETSTIFFKIGGTTQTVIDELVGEMKKISHLNHAQKFEFAADEEAKEELWEARKVALWSVLDQGKLKSPGARIWTTDVAVPISKFAKVIQETKEEMDKSGLINAIVGHAGDGNFHAFIVYTNKDELERVKKIVGHMVHRALYAEGTCTGEHGVGIGKRTYLHDELGDTPIDLMRRIKIAIDPKRIMNPDKIFPIDPEEPESIVSE